jgi:mRNA interferase MazF
LVLSPASYNRAVGLAVCCPITNQVKGYPFEVALPATLNVTGVVLSDHLRSLDWRARRADFACTAPESVVEEVLEKVNTLLT